MKTIYVMLWHLIVSIIAIFILLCGVLSVVNIGLDIYIKCKDLNADAAAADVKIDDLAKFEIIDEI